jgi:hypothetical protein
MRHSRQTILCLSPPLLATLCHPLHQQHFLRRPTPRQHIASPTPRQRITICCLTRDLHSDIILFSRTLHTNNINTYTHDTKIEGSNSRIALSVRVIYCHSKINVVQCIRRYNLKSFKQLLRADNVVDNTLGQNGWQ